VIAARRRPPDAGPHPDGDAELLRALHDAHGPDLHRFALRLTEDRQLAEDVVQETLLRAWRRPEVLGQDDDVARAWMFTVARNLVIDDRRSARHRREVDTAVVPEGPGGDSTEDVLDVLLIADALAALSADHRAVVVDAYYLGHTVPEIAARLQIPAGTVKSRLHYGLRALRLALQERGVTR
jgi:RNA polymerase sigma-70 factor (ECF subfamily)